MKAWIEHSKIIMRTYMSFDGKTQFFFFDLKQNLHVVLRRSKAPVLRSGFYKSLLFQLLNLLRFTTSVRLFALQPKSDADREALFHLMIYWMNGANVYYTLKTAELSIYVLKPEKQNSEFVWYGHLQGWSKQRKHWVASKNSYYIAQRKIFIRRWWSCL